MELYPLRPVPGWQAPEQPASGVRVEEAAREFEALLLARLLKSAREAGFGGWLGTDSEDAAAAAMEMAEEEFARALAMGGGLGLARLIREGLEAAETAKRSAPTRPDAGKQD
jgi:Rod binding domain-containing protein